MITKKDPAFLFYATAWLQGEKVRGLSHEQRGAYMDLLCFAWLHHGIPNDEKWIARALGWTPKQMSRLWPAMRVCWVERDGRLISERQETEREERRLKTEEMRRRGQAGGESSALRRASQ